MGYDTKISSNAREQLEQFLGVFYTRFSKPRLKFLRQMLYGIQITKSVILNKIAAEIDENIKQSKIEMRLSHHLAFKDLWKHIHEAVMEHARKFVRKSTLIIIDPSDVQKPYAKKMQFLAKVWDGSKGRVGDNLGYWGCMAVACEPGRRRGVVPLQFRLWSTEDPEYKGENAEIEAIIDSIRAEVGNKGIYVYDRGGDRNEIFRYFISNGLDFIVRMMQNRYLMYEGVRQHILVLAAKCHTPHTSVVAFNANGEEKDTTIHYGAMPVRLPENPDFPGMHEKDLRLVVVRGFGQCAMLILTTLQGDGSKEDVWRVVQGYLTRWRVEETIRFVKQSYQVEDMRTLTLARLRNLAALVLAVAYFVMVWIGKSERREVLRTHIVETAKRIYGAPEFFYYALADGIQKLFTRFGKWSAKLDLKKVLLKPSPQLEFAFADGDG